MEAKNFYVPSLTVVLDEQNFFLSEKSLSIIKRLDEPTLNIFHILHNNFQRQSSTFHFLPLNHSNN